MTVEELKAGAEELGYYLSKKPDREKKLPCICGRKHIQTWFIGTYGRTARQYACPKCGRKTDFYNTEEEAKMAWNKMISEELNEQS